jgi:Uma2 family endonuclease
MASTDIETQGLITAAQLWEQGAAGRWELVRGELKEISPAGSRHGIIAMRIACRLAPFVEARGLGVTFAAETGFLLDQDPDTVRAADLSFVATARASLAEDDGFFPGPPDLAVEVLSPSDRVSDVADKVEMWLKSGCRAVWIVDPRREKGSICLLEAGYVVSRESDVLRDEAMLPDFALPVVELWGA